MADTTVTKKTNITTVCEEDKIFIRALMSLSSEKKMHLRPAGRVCGIKGMLGCMLVGFMWWRHAGLTMAFVSQR